MDDEPDYELHRTRVDTAPPPPQMPERPIGLWIAIGSFTIVAGAAAYLAFFWRPSSTPAPAASSTKSTPVTETLPPLGGKAEPITLPPLDASDTLVRTLVQKLSESPAVMAWLPTSGLIRNFVVVVSNIAEGATPAKQLKVLKPTGPFRVVQRDGIFVDPRSYERYGMIADAVSSIDPAGASKLYATLKPRIEEAHRDLGVQNVSFDRTLQRAIASLLDTPVVDTPPRLRLKGIGYGFADDQLENLTAAQRQLLRMGPRNQRAIQARLREIAVALGIPQSAIRNQ